MDEVRDEFDEMTDQFAAAGEQVVADGEDYLPEEGESSPSSSSDTNELRAQRELRSMEISGDPTGLDDIRQIAFQTAQREEPGVQPRKTRSRTAKEELAFGAMQQRPGEDVLSFHHRILLTYQRLHPEPGSLDDMDDVLIESFLMGLSDDGVRGHVLQANPDTYDQAGEKAVEKSKMKEMTLAMTELTSDQQGALREPPSTEPSSIKEEKASSNPTTSAESGEGQRSEEATELEKTFPGPGKKTKQRKEKERSRKRKEVRISHTTFCSLAEYLHSFQRIEKKNDRTGVVHGNGRDWITPGIIRRNDHTVACTVSIDPWKLWTSVMSQTTMEALGIHPTNLEALLTEPEDQKLLSQAGLEILGRMPHSLRVQLGEDDRQPKRKEFFTVVKGLHIPCHLGARFFQCHGLKLDRPTGYMTKGNHISQPPKLGLNLRTLSTKIPLPERVVLKIQLEQHVSLAPYQHALVKASIPYIRDSSEKGGDFLIQGQGSFTSITGTYPWKNAVCQVCDNGKLLVGILNANAVHLAIRKNFIYGTARRTVNEEEQSKFPWRLKIREANVSANKKAGGHDRFGDVIKAFQLDGTSMFGRKHLALAIKVMVQNWEAFHWEKDDPKTPQNTIREIGWIHGKKPGIPGKPGIPWSQALVPILQDGEYTRMCPDFRGTRTVAESAGIGIYVGLIEGRRIKPAIPEIFSLIREKNCRGARTLREEGKKISLLPEESYSMSLMHSRLISLARLGAQWNHLAPFLNSCHIYSSTVEEHLRVVHNVLDELTKKGVRLTPSSCEFFTRSADDFLGMRFEICGMGIAPQYQRALLTERGYPKTKNDLKRLLRKCNLHEAFIPQYAEVRKALNTLIMEDDRKMFQEGLNTGEVRALLIGLKNAVFNAPVLAQPNHEKGAAAIEVEIKVDYEKRLTTAMCSQRQGHAVLLLGYGSNIISPISHRNADEGEEESWDLIEERAVTNYLEEFGNLLRYQDPRKDHNGRKLYAFHSQLPGTTIRLGPTLGPFRKRKGHAPAWCFDPQVTISRATSYHSNTSLGSVITTRITRTAPTTEAQKIPEDRMDNLRDFLEDLYPDAYEGIRTKAGNEFWTFDFLRRAQQKDKGLMKVLNDKLVAANRGMRSTSGPSEEDQAWHALEERLFVDHNDIVRFNKTGLYEPGVHSWIVLPKSLWRQALSRAHEAIPHRGVNEMIQEFQRELYMPRVNQVAQEIYQECRACHPEKDALATRPLRIAIQNTWEEITFLRQLRPCDKKWSFSEIACQFIGPLPRNEKGHQFILAVRDLTTYWIDFQPTKDDQGSTAAEVLQTIIFPRYVECSRIAPMTSMTKDVALAAEIAGILKKLRAPPPGYMPRRYPAVRSDFCIGRRLRSDFVQEEPQRWEQFLPRALFRLRTEETHPTGLTPLQNILGKGTQYSTRQQGRGKIRVSADWPLFDSLAGNSSQSIPIRITLVHHWAQSNIGELIKAQRLEDKARQIRQYQETRQVVNPGISARNWMECHCQKTGNLSQRQTMGGTEATARAAQQKELEEGCRTTSTSIPGIKTASKDLPPADLKEIIDGVQRRTRLEEAAFQLRREKEDRPASIVYHNYARLPAAKTYKSAKRAATLAPTSVKGALEEKRLRMDPEAEPEGTSAGSLRHETKSPQPTFQGAFMESLRKETSSHKPTIGADTELYKIFNPTSTANQSTVVPRIIIPIRAETLNALTQVAEFIKVVEENKKGSRNQPAAKESPDLIDLEDRTNPEERKGGLEGPVLNEDGKEREPPFATRSTSPEQPQPNKGEKEKLPIPLSDAPSTSSTTEPNTSPNENRVVIWEVDALSKKKRHMVNLLKPTVLKQLGEKTGK